LETDRTLLALRGVNKTFPGVKALDNVDFDLQQGEVHALVGENGAGKSTLMKILTGVYTMDTGQIFIDNQPVQVRDVHHARKFGISIIFQELSQVPQLTVAQNIFLGEEPRRAFGVLNERVMVRRAANLLEAYQIHLDPTSRVERLSTAERQLAEIAKAVSLGSRILIMDEPTSSLTLDETENLFRIVNTLRARSVGIIYISHRMDEISRLADRITILRDGQNVGTFAADEISIEQVVHLMVGRQLEAVKEEHTLPSFFPAADQPPMLAVKGLTRDGKLNDITFSLKQGEILGLAGLMGSGRSELARALIGIDAIDTGEVCIDGQPVHIQSPGAALAAGIALLPEDRRLQGLVLRHTVEQNVTLPLLPHYSRNGIVNSRACRRVTLESMDQLRIRPRDPNRVVHFLSGGNQQKVVLAKWLAGKPRILILDEPTVGVDVGSKAEIHQLIRTLAAGGMGILLISSDMPEVINLSHRLLVMHDGRILGEFTQKEVTQEKIMSKIMDGTMARTLAKEGNKQ
jgi:ABC-type sugar transport system ATPase subunit